VLAARSCLCGGLALCSGAVTVTLGRGELGAVCETAVPVRPHNNQVDRIATAEGATRLDDVLIIRTPKSGAATWIFHPRTKAFGRAEHSSQCSDLAQRKTSITGSVRCVPRISAWAVFEIFYVGPAGRYITLQNGMSLAPAVGYSGVYGQSGPHSRRRR
jgi:hypothetical protein